MRKIKINPALAKTALAQAIIFLAFLFLVGYIWKVVNNSPYFAVKEVIIRGAAVDLSYLKDRNTFDIPLRLESENIIARYPDYVRVKIIRLLPDRLFVDFVRRVPYACVKLYRNFIIDGDGVFFNPAEAVDTQGLPLITGLETKIFGPKTGAAPDNKELRFALNIIKGFKANRVLRKFRIRKIDMANPEAVSIFINKLYIPLVATGDVEIKIWPDNDNEKIRLLSGLLKLYGNSTENIKYIDLRFKEPVIKFRNVKSP
jgi:hypothetical protein